MKRNLLVVLILFSNILLARELPRGNPSSVGMSAERLTRITEVVERHIEEGNVQSAVVGLARPGKLVYSETHRQAPVEKDIPMNTGSVVPIWVLNQTFLLY